MQHQEWIRYFAAVLNEVGICNSPIASRKSNLKVNVQFHFLKIAFLYIEYWKDSEVHFSWNILKNKSLSLVDLRAFCLYKVPLYMYQLPGPPAQEDTTVHWRGNLGIYRRYRSRALRMEESHFMVKFQHHLFQVTPLWWKKGYNQLPLQRHQILCK